MHLAIKRAISLITVIVLLLINISCDKGITNNGHFTDTPDNSKIEETVKRLNDYLDKNYKDSFSGSIFVSAYGKILFSKGYGMADYENCFLNTPVTSFDIASLTEQFTAMGIMILYEKGLLSISDNINKFIPWIDNGDRITIHQLLNHTSGITDLIYKDIPLKEDKKYTIAEVIKDLKDKKIKLMSEPGKSFNNCNFNYLLLGYIIEKVSGKSYENFITDKILQPLEMYNSGFYGRGVQVEDQAAGYSGISPRPVKAEMNRMEHIYAASGLYSSVEDLYKWDKALYSEKLISKKSLEAIFKGYKGGYGYGWNIKDNTYGVVAECSGKANGFCAQIKRKTDSGLLIVILSNNENSEISLLIDGIDKVLDSDNKQ